MVGRRARTIEPVAQLVCATRHYEGRRSGDLEGAKQPRVYRFTRLRDLKREMARAEVTIPAFVVTGGASDDRN